MEDFYQRAKYGHKPNHSNVTKQTDQKSKPAPPGQGQSAQAKKRRKKREQAAQKAQNQSQQGQQSKLDTEKSKPVLRAKQFDCTNSDLEAMKKALESELNN